MQPLDRMLKFHLEDRLIAGLQAAQAAVTRMLQDPLLLQTIVDTGCHLADRLADRGRVFSCGNGGSMSDAMHFAEELSGRYRTDRPALGATAISDVGHLTCVANDFGYDQVFARYLAGNGRPGDVLLAISTSGSSRSIVEAAREAKAQDMSVIALTGQPGSLLEQQADFTLCTPAGTYADRVQECHIKVIHSLIDVVEQRLFTQWA